MSDALARCETPVDCRSLRVGRKTHHDVSTRRKCGTKLNSAVRPLCQKGASLIELLVVVVILAVLATVVSLSVTGVSSRQLENTARRLQALLQLACEQSVLTGREVGLRMAVAEFEFVYFSGDAWLGVEQLTGVDRAPMEALRKRSVDAGIEWRVERDGETLTLFEGLPEMPQWVCFDSGELTAIDILMRREDVSTEWHLQAQIDGRIVLEAKDVER